MKKKQYLIIGLGRFGSALATELCRQGMEVLAIDRDMELVEAHRHVLTDVVQGEAMERAVLERIGAESFDAAVVTMGDDIRSSGTIVMHLKELGVKYIIAKAADDFHGRMLLKLGADKIVFPERDMGQRIAHNLVSERILDFIELSPEYALMEIRPQPEWVGRPLSALDLRGRYDMNVVAIRSGEKLTLPKHDTCLNADDVMLVVGMMENS